MARPAPPAKRAPAPAFVRGDVVQVTDEADPWYGCLLTVTEVKSWGVQAFAMAPASNDPAAPATALYYRRPRNEALTRVGHVALGLE